MPTNRVPISRQKSNALLPAEAVTIYKKMLLRPRDDEVWWELHNRLVHLLNTPPHIWPLLPHPGEAPMTKFQIKLQRQLEAMLEERELLEATRLP